MLLQKFMVQPLVLGLIVVSALLLGPAAILVAAALIAGWAVNNRLRRGESNRTQ
tara:strand:+ start:121 stop:282 length:162 start_codon:yes stop_codon:yes gene_type:complete